MQTSAMTDRSVPPPARGLAIAALIAMASGVIVVLGDIASLPPWILIAAASAFVLSVVAFGVLTYRDARSSGSRFGPALARSLRTASKVFVALLP